MKKSATAVCRVLAVSAFLLAAAAPVYAAPATDKVAEHIATLHGKLMITPEEESAWKAVADQMTANETAIHDLIKKRHDNAESMTAVDDLQSYQQITQAHADGLQKTVAAFQPLYNQMTDAQKKNADTVFGQFEGHRHHAAK